MAEDGNLLGRPRVLQAAILLEKSKNSVGTEKNEIVNMAYKNFRTGVGLDPEAWKRILRITSRTKYEGFTKEVQMLSPYLDEWLPN